jgi:hypothetical protein
VPDSSKSALLRAGLAFRHCGGFRVHSPDGYIGFVEDVLFGCDADRPVALAVRSGLFRPRVELVALEDIVEILPSERRLIVRALPPS